jgi:hypothetical protein
MSRRDNIQMEPTRRLSSVIMLLRRAAHLSRWAAGTSLVAL